MTTIREVARRLNISITTASRALDGYSDVAEDTRQLVIKTTREMGYTFRSGGYQAAQQLLALRPLPTTITCINNLTAISVLHAASEQGLNVGSDLAVAGFDGIEDGEQTSPSLTTFSQPLYEIIRSLVKMLVASIQNLSLEERRIRMQPELNIRESTGGVNI